MEGLRLAQKLRDGLEEYACYCISRGHEKKACSLCLQRLHTEAIKQRVHGEQDLEGSWPEQERLLNAYVA